MESEIEYVPNSHFIQEPDVEPQCAPAHRRELTPLPQLAEGELLPPDSEASLFHDMNLLKFQARETQAQLSLDAACGKLVERIERLLQRAAEIRNLLIRANVRLVVSVAKKFASARHPLPELVSDGNLTLFRAIEKFDYARGFRFSTYATWALRYNFSRAVGKSREYVGFMNPTGEQAPEVVDYRRAPAANQAALVRHRTLERMLEKLDDRERVVISRRYGLEAGEEERSLQELADEMSICKERVRQLQMRALDKLRRLAEASHLEPPGDL